VPNKGCALIDNKNHAHTGLSSVLRDLINMMSIGERPGDSIFL